VFDGRPEELDATVLTRIYGEKDWTAAPRQRAGGEEEADTIDIDEERLAGMT
jgi:hypothetical protein